jgi:uncharacterized protein (DUF885 family)
VEITAAPATSTLAIISDGSEVSAFRSSVDTITQSLLVLQPELVTDLGADSLIGFDAGSFLSDLSPRGRIELARAAEVGLETLDAASGDLKEGERLSAEILHWYLEDVVAMAAFGDYENPVNFITGAHTGFGEFMADVHPINSERDAEAYVDRLIAFRVQMQDTIEELQRLDDLGIAPTVRSLDIARYQIGAAIGNGDEETHPLVTDLKDRVAALSGESRSWAAGVGAQAEAAVRNLLPTLTDLDAAVRSVDGRSDQAPGVLNLPGGEDYYAAVLRHYLSAHMTPQEVHELGLAQVDRVRAELTESLAELGYAAEEDFVRAIRAAAADAGAMPTTTEAERSAVLERAAATVDEAAEVFGEMFSVKPDAALEVVRPRPGREGGTGAYYRSPPVDGSRPGVYYLSLGGAEFGELTMDTTTYHEAIPGHHFQLSVQRSLDELPIHQRVFDFTGYAEGWALYAERLASEAGLYVDDPLGDIGRLQMELLRAARMVADTGIHWDGWSRNQAIDYMMSLGFVEGRAIAEVDRYIVWPGQAPAYMVGMLEILRLRDEAQAELGDRFDLVGFHDALLSQGSVPLALLDEVVAAWVADVG